MDMCMFHAKHILPAVYKGILTKQVNWKTEITPTNITIYKYNVLNNHRCQLQFLGLDNSDKFQGHMGSKTPTQAAKQDFWTRHCATVSCAVGPQAHSIGHWLIHLHHCWLGNETWVENASRLSVERSTLWSWFGSPTSLRGFRIFVVTSSLASTPPGMPGTHPHQYFGWWGRQWEYPHQNFYVL